METNGIHIVDHGRGPQLSTSRITVQDLVPYLQQNYAHEQILQIMPVLTVAEIQAVERYVQDNYDAVMEQDRRIRERNAARQKLVDVEEAERKEQVQRLEAARRLIREKKQEQNGDPLLADVNIEGHAAILVSRMQSDFWREVWDFLDIRLRTFQEVGLSPDDTDAHVWLICQQQQCYLLTNNRNDDGPNSLEATIRTCNTASSLPVFTLSDAERILRGKDYAERVVETLFDKLLRIEDLRRAGRLYLP